MVPFTGATEASHFLEDLKGFAPLGGALLLADLPGGINLVRAMSRSLQPSLQSARLIVLRGVAKAGNA